MGENEGGSGPYGSHEKARLRIRRVSRPGCRGLRVGREPGQRPREPESRLDSGPGLSVGVTFFRGNDTTGSRNVGHSLLVRRVPRTLSGKNAARSG